MDNDKRRSSNWSFIVYPESAPKEWREYLKSYKVPFAVSPLHEYDVNDEGELKKPHYHCVIKFDSLKSYSQVKEIIDCINQPRPEICHSLRGSVRYFWHLDDPEKYQYDMSQYESYCGFSIDEALQPTPAQAQRALLAIVNICRATNINSYKELVHQAVDGNFDNDMTYAILHNSIFFNAYFRK